MCEMRLISPLRHRTQTPGLTVERLVIFEQVKGVFDRLDRIVDFMRDRAREPSEGRGFFRDTQRRLRPPLFRDVPVDFKKGLWPSFFVQLQRAMAGDDYFLGGLGKTDQLAFPVASCAAIVLGSCEERWGGAAPRSFPRFVPRLLAWSNRKCFPRRGSKT